MGVVVVIERADCVPGCGDKAAPWCCHSMHRLALR
jgi:hypothetical protein